MHVINIKYINNVICDCLYNIEILCGDAREDAKKLAKELAQTNTETNSAYIFVDESGY